MKPELHIFKDLESLSREAANLFASRAAQSIEERNRFLVALNGGSTPARLFQLLATEYRDQVNWSKVNVFWSDERCVPYDDPGSNYGQAQKSFLERVSIPQENIHGVNTRLSPASAAMDYTFVLSQFADSPLPFPRFDLVLLGMGEDGHTASLFPGSPVDVAEPAMPVTAEYQDRPANRVTLTPVIFNEARLIVFMAAGANKANTLAEVVRGRYNPDLYPAQRIKPRNGRLIWLVDEAAGAGCRRSIRES